MIKPIETEYNGYRFRSRLEARWAYFFDLLGIKYEYEPEGIVLSDGSKYLPDFYLPQLYCYFEVKHKGVLGTRAEEKARWKISNGAWTDSFAGLICFGDPYEAELTLYCQAFTDDSGGDYEGEVILGDNPFGDGPALFAPDDIRDRTFIPEWGFDDDSDDGVLGGDEGDVIPCYTNTQTSQECVETRRVLEARKTARQARFEHGETPEAPNAIPDTPKCPIYHKNFEQNLECPLCELCEHQHNQRCDFGVEIGWNDYDGAVALSPDYCYR